MARSWKNSNLVIYDIYDRVKWASNTSDTCKDGLLRHDASPELVLQDDGSLVLHCGGRSIWDTGTLADLAICLGVAMQNDGSLAVYNVEANRAFGPVLALCLWVAEAT